ncbi:MAG: hypothetical protein U5L45_06715 [Saprospiraceae bacterium]|nr:hypothetical protein [Saprospiraceae bacterium]
MAHELTCLYPEVAYFPAYELLLDTVAECGFMPLTSYTQPEQGEQLYLGEKFAEAYFFSPKLRNYTGKFKKSTIFGA